MRVVLDASSFVSAVLKQDSIPERALFRALAASNRLIVSRAVADEYHDVLFRPKFDRFVSIVHHQRMLDLILVASEAIEPIETVTECRDPKDDKNLTLAAAGQADIIVSSDIRHLLSMHPWRGISILSPADFLALP